MARASSPGPGRPRTLLMALGLLALVVGGVLAWTLLPPRQQADVPMPADDAAPEQVVAAYLQALDAHDCDTARALTTDRLRSSASSWCEDLAGLSEVDVRASAPVRADALGAGVDVTFDLDWRLFHDDGSMPEGPTTWGYGLVRADADAPWRLDVEGTG